MSIKDVIKQLAKESGTNMTKLEQELGFGNGTILKWDKASPSIDKLQAVADYFNVSIDYLTGRTNEDYFKFIDSKTDLDELRKQVQYYIELDKNDKVLADVYNSKDKERLVSYAKKLHEIQKLDNE